MDWAQWNLCKAGQSLFQPNRPSTPLDKQARGRPSRASSLARSLPHQTLDAHARTRHCAQTTTQEFPSWTVYLPSCTICIVSRAWCTLRPFVNAPTISSHELRPNVRWHSPTACPTRQELHKNPPAKTLVSLEKNMLLIFPVKRSEGAPYFQNIICCKV
jgi:hypothetical protein